MLGETNDSLMQCTIGGIKKWMNIEYPPMEEDIPPSLGYHPSWRQIFKTPWGCIILAGGIYLLHQGVSSWLEAYIYDTRGYHPGWRQISIPHQVGTILAGGRYLPR
jgi:hypothetical protein